MKLSVLVVTFNRPDDLLELLQSVANQEGAAEVLEELLILDNGTSVDYSRCWDFVSQHPELPIRVLRSDSNIGAAILRTRASQILAAMKGDAPGAAAFDVDTMRKDLRYMEQEAVVHDSSLPLAKRTLECFDRASREGGGQVDGVAYPAYWISRQRAAARGGAERATQS